MKILLTGAFGNIGRSTLDELLARGHHVRCFDRPTPANRRAARKLAASAGPQIDFIWGDLCCSQDVARAVQGREAVLHVAFVIPKLSVTGVNSEDRPEWAREVNVGGTANLIRAIQAEGRPVRLLFTSSLHVYGRTQDQAPPRRICDEPQPVEHYAHHKVECEQMVKSSGLEWTILRLGAALPLRLIMDRGMFDVPLENRIEFVHTRDVGLAIANALECPEAWGKTLLIGGGPRCQLTYREMVTTVLEASGVGLPPERAFSTVQFSTDWLDTTESQALLHFQRLTLDDYAAELRQKLGGLRDLVRAFRPLIQRWLLRYSPYWKGS